MHGAWIDFTAENEYGKTVKTVEFAPGGVLVLTDPIISGVHELPYSANTEVYRMEVYGIGGAFVATIRDSAQLFELPAGVYIVKYYDSGNRCIKVSKTLVR